jgi:hypothetical protein
MLPVEVGEDEITDGSDDQGLREMLRVSETNKSFPFLLDGKSLDGPKPRTIFHWSSMTVFFAVRKWRVFLRWKIAVT